MKTQFIKSKKFLVAILIISLIANAYLVREVYMAKKLDTVVALNHYDKWETKFQVYTGYLGRFLESSEEESYYRMLGLAEDIRTFKTVPGAHYYGRKNVEELSLSVLNLSNQINDIVNEYFYEIGFENLSPQQVSNLQEFHHHLEVLSHKLDDSFWERIESDMIIPHEKIQLEVSNLLEETIKQNEEILSELENR